MLVFCLVKAQRTHGIIHAQCVFGCAAEDDVAGFYLSCGNFLLLLLECSFTLAVLVLTFYPYFFFLGILFFGLKLLYGSMHGCIVALA